MIDEEVVVENHRKKPNIVAAMNIFRNRLDPTTDAAVRRFVAGIASKYDIAQVIVYGSRARGEYHPDSDADVAIILRGPHARFLPTKLAMADVAFDSMLETGILVSPLPVWVDEWEHPEFYSNPSLLRNIEMEGVHV